MSVVGKSVKDQRAVEAYQPVGLVNTTTGAPITPGVDSSGNAVRYNADGTPYQPTYTLPGSPVTIAGSGNAAFAANVTGGSYIFNAVFGGTTPSLKLQSLAADGVTYQDVGTALTASGSVGVVVGQNATLRLLNNTANPITGLSANLT